jgi:PAS domain S-box-containing protein
LNRSDSSSAHGRPNGVGLFGPGPWRNGAGLAVAFYILATLSWNFTIRSGTYVSLWLPTGLYVAALLASDRRYWGAMVACAAAANLTFDLVNRTIPVLAVAFTLFSALQACVSAAIYRRVMGAAGPLSSLKAFFTLVAGSATVGVFLILARVALVGATVGLPGSFLVSWGTWSLGTVMSVLTMAPIVLAWLSPGDLRAWPRLGPLRLIEACLVVAGLVAVTLALLAKGEGILSPASFTIIPFILWSALRLGTRGASVVNLVLATLLVYGAMHDGQRVPPEELVDGAFILKLYGFLAVCAVAGLVPAIAVSERDRLVEWLGESDERYRNLAAAANEGVVISENGRVIDANDQVLRLFRCERRDLIGGRIIDFVSPESRASVLETVAAGRDASGEHRLIRPDGTLFHAETRAKMMRSGARTLRMTTVRDVSSRKEAEAMLNGQFRVLEMIAAGRPLRDILDTLIRFVEEQSQGVGSILVRDGENLRILAAPGLPEGFGAPAGGLPIAEGQGACGTAAHRKQPVLVGEIQSDPLSAAFAQEAARLGFRACWSMPVLDSKQRLLGTFAIYHRSPGLPDASQRKLLDIATHSASVAISRDQDEAALKLSDFSVNQASTPTFWAARDARIVRANRAACEMLGYSEAELLTLTVLDLHPGLDRAAWEAHWEEARVLRRMHFDAEQRRKDGRIILLEMDINWFEFEGAEYHFVFAHDITERRQLEERLRQSQKMEAIGQLSGGIAHDFNNLLTVVLGNLGMIRLAGGITPAAEESLQQIGQAVNRASNLTEQLLAFGRKQVMQTREVDLNEVVDTFSKMLRRVIGENVEVSLSFSPGPLTVRADPSMLEQVMLNLSINARDAMPRGGSLSLGTESVQVAEADLDRMPAGRAGSFARLSVTDTGVGIAPEHMVRLFEPFFTTKDVGKGTGLGLASVYGILQQHEGWITVESGLGRGSCFRVYLPLREPTGAPPPEAAREAGAPGGSETILLVEDDPAVRLVAGKALDRLGYRVLVASNGSEARELFQRHGPDIRLLLTDMVMPGGQDGADLARAFKAIQPSLKAILMSGYSADLAGTDFLSSGGDSFLGKPFEIAELAAAIRRCLARP